MNTSSIMVVVSGALQLPVAIYALRLNRLFGPSNVGWSLFWAFLLMALSHLVQSAMQFSAGAQFGIEINVMYSLISMLLLIGMFHLETVLKERMRLKAQLELEVKKKTAFLTRALEELQAEIDERKRMEAEIQTSHWQLRAVSHQAEMARIATEALASVGEMIQNVNVSASLVSDQVKQSKIANVVRVGALIRDHMADLGRFMAQDPRGQKLPLYLAELAESLAAEQSNLLNELESIKRNLEKLVVMQQTCARLSGVTEMTIPVPPAQAGPAQEDSSIPSTVATEQGVLAVG